MPFTEFYVHPQGSNLNAGSTSGLIPIASGINGLWDSTQNLFLGSVGCMVGVSSGMYASLFTISTTDKTGYVAEVVEVLGTGGNESGIRTSTLCANGTKPTTASASRNCIVGGAWRGPTGSIGFPLNWIGSNLTNPSLHPIRVNINNSEPYTISAAMTLSTASTRGGAMTFQGYSNTIGDSGRAIIQGPQTGASITLWTTTIPCEVNSMHFRWNGNSGGAALIQTSSSASLWRRCLFTDYFRFVWLANGSLAEDCEFYNGDLGNNDYGLVYLSTANLERCIIHNSSGLNCHGLTIAGPANIDNCQIFRIGGNGIQLKTISSLAKINGCDFYKVNGNVIQTNGSSTRMNQLIVENCNFIACSGYLGYETIPGNNDIVLRNCGLYNTSSTIIGDSVGWRLKDMFTYSANPFTDADNGDFTLSDEAANKGVYSFEGVNVSAHPVGYADVGSVQKLQTGGGIEYIPSGIPGRVAINRNRIIGGY